jgi:hypothetical protein
MKVSPIWKNKEIGYKEKKKRKNEKKKFLP